MTADIPDLKQKIIQYRKRLREIEALRSGQAGESPPDLWQEFVEISHQLEEAQQEALKRGQRIAQECNQIREAVLEKLAAYQRLRTQMRDIEALFLAYIVRPGQKLRQVVRNRQALEEEYERIEQKIEHQAYLNQQELEEEIYRILMAQEEPSLEEDVEPDNEPAYPSLSEMLDFEVQELVDELEKERITREFKKVVLPAVHPDTSDEEGQGFPTVYAVYEQRDYLLMEAYIVKYRGAVKPDREQEGLEILEEMRGIRALCRNLDQRLSKRLKRLKKRLTQEELNHPERLKKRMEKQRQEILERIQVEAERIMELRHKLEGFLQDDKSTGGDTS